jgi:hypothetical protein
MENSSLADAAVCPRIVELGSDSDGTPVNESPCSEELAITSSRQFESAPKVVAHASLQSRVPIALDVVDPMEEYGGVVMAGTSRPGIERYQCSTQFGFCRCPEA